MDKLTLAKELRKALEQWEGLAESRKNERETLRRKIHKLCDELDKLDPQGL